MFQYWIPLVILLFLMFLVFRLKKLTAAGSLTGGAIAIGIFLGAGYTGVIVLAAFFVMATVATSWRKSIKESQGLQEANKGQRTAGQVFANGGAAALIGCAAICFPQIHDVANVMIAGAFSAATADTLSSELGNVYGRKFFNILTLKKDERGLDGVISFEGTIAGLAGSIVIGLIFYLGDRSAVSILTVTAAGLAGNLADSFLGAAFERRGGMENNLVNFINTVVGAVAALLFMHLF